MTARRRFRQTISLENRLGAEADRLRKDAHCLPIGLNRPGFAGGSNS
jgi:hypothetical protein